MRIGRTILAACLAVAVLAPPRPARARSAEPKPIRLVPADDVALSVLFLIGEGRERPVLLFDPRDRDAVDRFAGGRKSELSCAAREQTGKTTRHLLREVTGRHCEEVGDLIALAHELWPAPKAAVATSAGDYPWLLRAAAFAGATGSALLLVDAPAALSPHAVEGWDLDTLYVAGPLAAAAARAEGLAAHVVGVEQPDTFTTELRRHLGLEAPSAVVVANPTDRAGIFSPSSLSLLAPLLCAVHRAPLFLVADSAADAIERDTSAWMERNGLQPTYVILVGDELALRSHRVPDPVLQAGGPEARGGGTEVRVEIFSQIQKEQPQDYAVGRVVGENAAQASATLARQLHRHRAKRPRPVVLLSNADQVFSLGETISRATVSELRNTAVPVRAYFRDEVTPEAIQHALRGTDLLIWEGHARDLTLEERGGISTDTAPATVVLQGCYTLDRSDPFILMQHGTQAIVATSAAIYSSSGSAFAHALVDSLVYGHEDLGTAVRNARNYLLALTRLKRNREHQEWHKTYRAALAFALWGDPTLRPELPAKKPVLSPARWKLGEGELDLKIPERSLPASAAGSYYADPVPRAMLGGLVLQQTDAEKRRRLKALFFATEPQPSPAAACAPSPAWDVVSLYAPRTRTLSVLARPDWERMHTGAEHGTFSFPLVPEGGSCRDVELHGPPAAG
jgi:hypothetical protein